MMLKLTKCIIIIFYLSNVRIGFNILFVLVDPEFDAQVPAACVPGEAEGGRVRPRHGYRAGAVPQLRLPRDAVHRRDSLPEPVG